MTMRLLLAITIVAASAGCLSGSSDDLQPATTQELELPFTAAVVQGNIEISAATPLRTVNYGGEYVHAITVSEETTGFVIELAWSAASPATEKLSLWMRPAGEGTVNADDPLTALQAGAPLAKVSGTTGLRMVLPADAFPELGDYDLVVRAADEPVGVAIEQTFSLHVATFTGTFDADHTSLE